MNEKKTKIKLLEDAANLLFCSYYGNKGNMNILITQRSLPPHRYAAMHQQPSKNYI